MSFLIFAVLYSNVKWYINLLFKNIQKERNFFAHWKSYFLLKKALAKHLKRNIQLKIEKTWPSRYYWLNLFQTKQNKTYKTIFFLCVRCKNHSSMYKCFQSEDWIVCSGNVDFQLIFYWSGYLMKQAKFFRSVKTLPNKQLIENILGKTECLI